MQALFGLILHIGKNIASLQDVVDETGNESVALIINTCDRMAINSKVL